ncbi:DUF3244 domain-containing protein [Autumnicola musiva]|uniref:Secretion system C-terminal sorting domain-containing protein n=1 Tax=Autumnicola musiva TaxID=3075589 RepID=A0ABU3D671_9FLAO|nr:hypothetical protein [Zunongwangia sp. F117]MDT0676850.1 hypothetical protein [Zunongwangia sp. F117]
MKNVFRLLSFILLIGISFNVKAADLAVKVKEKTILIELRNPVEGATLSLLDEQGKMLFRDGLIAKNAYTKALDLSDAPQGTYYLQFENEYHIHTKVIKKDEAGIHVEDKSSAITFKPSFRINNKQVLLSLTNPTEGAAKVKVYNSLGELIATAEGKGIVVTKTIDFKNVPVGEYTIEISTKENNFLKIINLG